MLAPLLRGGGKVTNIPPARVAGASIRSWGLPPIAAAGPPGAHGAAKIDGPTGALCCCWSDLRASWGRPYDTGRSPK
eukprot:5961799-Prymnesium_polylepis.1